MSRLSRMDGRSRRLRFESLEERRVLSTVTVSTASDVEDGNILSIALLIANPGPDNKISLREAIDAANRDQTDLSDTIQFVSSLNNATITLTTGELSISDSVTIDGRDTNNNNVSRNITINGGGGTNGIVGNFDGFRIFDISGFGGDVEINSLKLTGGDTPDSGGAISSSGMTLSVKNSLITGNGGQAQGGGINFYGSNATLNLINSTVSGNTTDGSGGGE